MHKRATPLEIFKLLDKSNCQECGMESCLEFATNLVDRRISLEKCTHLKRPNQRDQYLTIEKLLLPPQKEVIFGTPKRKCKLGGEEVMYRHERTFYNPTAIAVEVADNHPERKEIIKYLTKLTINRIGEDLTLDAVMIRNVSKDQNTFKKAIIETMENSDLPIILGCADPKILSNILPSIKDKFPNNKLLLYAATENSAEAFGVLAKEYNYAIVIHSDNLFKLHKMAESLNKFGVSDLVLDPGTQLNINGGISKTYNQIQQIRFQLFKQNVESWGYPIMGVPATIWTEKNIKTFEIRKEMEAKLKKLIEENKKKIQEEEKQKQEQKQTEKENKNNNKKKKTKKKKEKKERIKVENPIWREQFDEILTALTLEAIDVNLLILHTGQYPDEIWGLLGLMTFRQNIFTDPRVYPRVDPGLITIGNPGEWDPIYITSNYRMTAIPVEQDLIDAKLNGYLVIVDTEGIGIESATAGGQFNEERIKKTLESTRILEKVKHRIVIIPGMAARLQGPLEEISGLKVWVGPRDSSGIPKYIQENWEYEKIKAEFS